MFGRTGGEDEWGNVGSEGVACGEGDAGGPGIS